MLQPGDELHGYRIVRLVGQGAFGAVYQAQHLLLVDDQVAIKMLLQTTADPGEWQALLGQFLDEARLLRQLSHPRLAAVTDFFEEHHSAVGFKTAFMVMNYIDGETLEMFVQRNGPVPEATVLDWTRQITSVLNYLHHELPNPVLVRDLKPQNLMLSKGRIYLLDFGIARVGGTSNPTKTILRSLGTPGFCPLEQYVGGTSPRSDYYALGATMLYLLNGATPPEATERRTHQTPLPVPSNVSVETWDAVQALMQLRQEDRPGSIQEVHHLLPLNGKAQSPASGAAPRQVHHPPPAPSPDPAQAPAGSSSGASPTARGAPWPLPTQPPTVQMVPPSSVQNPTWYPPQTPGTQSIPAPLPPVAPPYGSGTSGNPARIIVRWSLVMTLCLALVGVVFLLRTPGIYNSPPGASPSSGIATSPTSPSTVAAPPPMQRKPIISTFTGQVTGVKSGDTLMVRRNGKDEEIRLQDIDSPESYTSQPSGDDAKAEMSRLALGRTVTVQVVKNTDPYGRVLAYVILPDNSDLSEAMVRDGFAWHYTDYSDNPRLDWLQSEAKTQKRGLWATSDPTPPWEWRRTHRK